MNVAVLFKHMYIYIYPDMIIYINYINNVHDTKPSLVLA